MENTANNPDPKRTWANKVKTAEHYSVSPRTIQTWQAVGLLVFFKIKRVVRYDLVASDALLKEHGMIQRPLGQLRLARGQVGEAVVRFTRLRTHLQTSISGRLTRLAHQHNEQPQPSHTPQALDGLTTVV
jgi:hypothetical protein